MTQGESKWVLRVYRRMPRWLSAALVRLVKPKHVIGVAGIVVNPAGEVLVLKHTYGSPLWRLPGGLLERGEDPAETAVRELREEACCIGQSTGVVDAVQSPYTFDIAVRIELIEELPFEPSPEVSERAWLGQDMFHLLPKIQQRFIRAAARKGTY